jgi:hypothetical protein
VRFHYHPDGMLPHGGEVFVFGSNQQGIHGAGAALAAARDYGAVWGRGIGRMGHSFAIPTKATPWNSLTLEEIRPGVDRFIRHARNHPDEQFFVTRVGCGLAGFSDQAMANLFALAPTNCSFAEQWKSTLEDVRV